MDLDNEVYGYIVRPFNGQIEYKSEFQYLSHLNLSNDGPSLKSIYINESEIDNHIKEKYQKYKSKEESQEPAGSGGMRYFPSQMNPYMMHGMPSQRFMSMSAKPMPQIGGMKKFQFRR